MRVDDGGSGRDIILVADMPLRHVDQMEMAEAARCVDHAGEAEVGAVGENRRQEAPVCRRPDYPFAGE